MAACLTTKELTAATVPPPPPRKRKDIKQIKGAHVLLYSRNEWKYDSVYKIYVD
jgi:hypothetical protein